ncbi:MULTISPECIES: fimbrial protein [Citrobacter]|jgi:major type 1 subunit fimbrin (pilin)|uniref:Type 1 fimbrial protein n=1 Tax=Citrobacter meridianamericanus TaxID=2894201 RepID=A0ABT1BCB8_9ENTR|nr:MULTISPECIES: fimbrial protein [Citrobacter]MBC6501256.1 type 1 fimbrial protein [Citrobacter freundii]HAT7567499.1 type 1 fimbrial protein [Citrobacter werkmanii]MBC6506122.1 type 1 fimbrial protein [Citrobacter freundii]MBP8544042.1 fimbrial protein [Citrobacter sp. On2M]MBW5274748.1 fimbrial protein [Citrobacter sp. On28M]
MKKIALISALVSLSISQVANAADGVINFTGNITGTACVVDATSIAQPVELGTISTAAFAGGNSTTAAAKRFNIVLKSCPASISSASIRFDGTTNTANPSILALTNGQTATNVGVAIYEQDSTTLIPVGSPSARVNLLEDVNNTLTYFAKYMATGVVGAGTANSSTSFTVTYQ